MPEPLPETRVIANWKPSTRKYLQRRHKKNSKFTNWFHPNNFVPPTIQTRANQHKSKKDYDKPVKTRAERYANSPLPYMTKLLNTC